MKKSKIFFLLSLFYFIAVSSASAANSEFENCVNGHYSKIINLLEEAMSKDEKNIKKSEIFFLNYILYRDEDIRPVNDFFYNKNKNYTFCGFKYDEFGSRTPMSDEDVHIGFETFNKFIKKKNISKQRVNDYLLEADRLGSPDAKAEVALTMITGKSQVKNISGALDKALESAKLGSSYGQLIAGGLYADLGWYDRDGTYSTKGISEDLILAYMWLNIAASANSNNSIFTGIDVQKQAITARDEIAKKMNASDISKAQKLSTKCLQSNYTDCKKSWW